MNSSTEPSNPSQSPSHPDTDQLGFWGRVFDPIRPDPSQLWSAGAAVFRAFVLWLGEVVVALLPLIAHVIVLVYSRHSQSNSSGDPVLIFPLEELNIATIVLSGLGLLVVFKVGIEGPRTNVTPFTYIAAMIVIVLLVSGSLLYALTSVSMSENDGNVTSVCLGLALLMSLLLTLEQAWLKAIDKE